MYLSTSAGIYNIVSFFDSLCHVSSTVKLTVILSHETLIKDFIDYTYYFFNKNITYISLK